MNDWQEGDLVEAVKGETRIIARLEARDDSLFFTGWGSGISSASYAGFRLTRLERAVPKVELPTVDGVYESSNWPISGGCSPYVLLGGQWTVSGVFCTDDELEYLGTLTRLEPVADTARKVLDEVVKQAAARDEEIWGLTWIKSQFGVTD